MKQNKSFIKLFSIGISWTWLGIFAIIPNLVLLFVGLLDRNETGFFIPVLTFSNYKQLFGPSFLTVLYDSMVLAVLSTLFCLLIGYPFAFFVARAKKKWRQWLLLLVIIPFWTNSLIRTYALILIIGAQGMVNKLLLWSGVISQPLQLMYTQFAVFLGLVYTMLPFMILPLYSSIEKLDPKLTDAAKDLGASPLKAFWHITLPLTFSGIIAGCMLVFLPSLACFYIPEILGGSKNMLLGTFIKDQFQMANNWPLGSAASSILTILLLVLALVYRLASKISDGKAKNNISTFGEGSA